MKAYRGCGMPSCCRVISILHSHATYRFNDLGKFRLNDFLLYATSAYIMKEFTRFFDCKYSKTI